MLQHVIDALSLGSLYALMALGIALVFGVMRLVNFAYGELIMIGGYCLYLFSDYGWIPVVVMTAVVVCVVSLLMERIAFRPVRGADDATLLVTSFALSFGLQNAAILIAGARTKGVDVLSSLTKPLTIGGDSIPWVDVVTIVVTLFLLASFTLFLRKTDLGIQVQASSEDFRMARLLGVRANRVIASTFAAGGIFATAVAVMLIVRTGSVSPMIGVQPTLIAFVATVVGGMGSLYGAVIGGYLLGSLTVVLQVTLPVSARPFGQAFIFAIVIVILLLRPRGIAGSPALRERI